MLDETDGPHIFPCELLASILPLTYVARQPARLAMCCGTKIFEKTPCQSPVNWSLIKLLPSSQDGPCACCAAAHAGTCVGHAAFCHGGCSSLAPANNSRKRSRSNFATKIFEGLHAGHAHSSHGPGPLAHASALNRTIAFHECILPSARCTSAV